TDEHGETVRELWQRRAAHRQVAHADPDAALRSLARLRRSRRWRRRHAAAAPGREHRVAVDFRLLQVGTELAVAARDDERVNRQLPRFVMRNQLESLREQRADHQLDPVGTRAIETGRLWWRAVFRFRDDVVAFRIDPRRSADNLKILEL